MRWLRRGVKFVVFAAVAVTFLGYVVMNLWNWLAPAVFGGRTIGFWQAIALLILTRILFGGFRGRPGSRRHWRHRMAERWEQMTPEERETFRQGLRGRCGGRWAANTGNEAAPEKI
jgi:Ca2+/H+ antiporter, TMEM165/GDT1 family